ncbi:MAG TPA: rod-binding protein [Pirellula sp.]|nr:rod-binding protein [Pirellula sp.]
MDKLEPPSVFKVESAPSNSSEANGLSDSSLQPQDEDLRKAFQDFVGQTLFSQMISSMRTTQDGAAYFDGGRAEKIFQGQLDQILSEKLSEASASKISDPMFKLFQLRRQ